MHGLNQPEWLAGPPRIRASQPSGLHGVTRTRWQGPEAPPRIPVDISAHSAWPKDQTATFVTTSFPKIHSAFHVVNLHGMAMPTPSASASSSASADSSWTVRLDSRRRPTLPDEALRSAGLVIGETLRVHVAEQGCLILETPAHALSRARSRIAHRPDYSVVDEFLAERAQEAR